MARFEGGNVYFKVGIGDGAPHELHGYVLDHYIAAGEASGHLGFPVTDVNQDPDGSTWAKFEFGAIVTCSPSGECVEVGAPADLSVRISDSPDPLKVGGNLAYLVTVRNGGPGQATDVVMTDTLPDSVLFVSADPSQGSCTGPSPVVCSLGTIASGGSASVKVVVVTTLGGTITDSGEVHGSEADPNPGNDSTSARTLVCTRLGTAGADVLKGTSGSDVICGLGGNDTIYGYGGADLIYAGNGNDVVYGGSGADRVYGGFGSDSLSGGWGNDTLYGGPGNDTLNGGPGTDTCLQGSGSGPRISCEH